MGIKAAGGVRTLEDLVSMVEAGATRVGASAGVKIVEQAQAGKSASQSSPPQQGGNY
jgi:deoxyribose-phosphate aldolase